MFVPERRHRKEDHAPEEMIRPLTSRAFGDMINELETYSFVRTKVISRGRYGKMKLLSMNVNITG